MDRERGGGQRFGEWLDRPARPRPDARLRGNGGRRTLASGRSGHRPPILFGRTGWSFAFVFCLYAYQGLVAGFALTALPNHRVELGASATVVA